MWKAHKAGCKWGGVNIAGVLSQCWVYMCSMRVWWMSRVQKFRQIDIEICALNLELNTLLIERPRGVLKCCDGNGGGTGSLLDIISRLNSLKTNKLLLFDNTIGPLPYPDSYPDLFDLRSCCKKWQSAWTKLTGNGPALLWTTALGHWVAYINKLEGSTNTEFTAIPRMEIVCNELRDIYLTKMKVFHTL